MLESSNALDVRQCYERNCYSGTKCGLCRFGRLNVIVPYEICHTRGSFVARRPVDGNLPGSIRRAGERGGPNQVAYSDGCGGTDLHPFRGGFRDLLFCRAFCITDVSTW